MKHLTLILGGTHSGKTTFALERGQSYCSPEQVASRQYYLATAQALDEGMATRIETRKRERASHWTTLEESIKVPDAFGFLNRRADVVVVDCLDLWLSHLLMIRSDYDILNEAETMIAAIKRVDFSVVIVSSEVGCGMAHADPISHLFTETLGRTHQALAAMADEVYFMVAGIPMRVKGFPSL